MESPSYMDKVKVLERCRVTPSPGSVSQTSLPLTFFDLLFIPLPPPELLFFYNFPTSKTRFTHSLLPHIKHSLSLTIEHFYPLAGNLTWSSEYDKPVIQCINGDSVSLTVAESSGDFYHISSNHARDMNELRPLVPPLPVSGELVPVLALQVTLFPNSGICIGLTVHHAVADGSAVFHFMKSWASVCRLGNTSLLNESLPFYDKSVIKDQSEIETTYLKVLRKFLHSEPESKSESDSDPIKRKFKVINPRPPPNAVRATFDLGRADVERLRKWVLARRKMDGEEIPRFHISTFVLACAYLWVCLVKAGQDVSSSSSSTDNKVSIRINIDCRARLDPPIPTTYFGNCVRVRLATAERSEITGEDGIAVAVDSIIEAIKGLENGGVLIGAEGWISGLLSIGKKGVVAVIGLNRFGFYETDFGWGRPKKVEVISIDRTGAITLSESNNGDGGVEICFVRSRKEMDAFASAFVNGLTLSAL